MLVTFCRKAKIELKIVIIDLRNTVIRSNIQGSPHLIKTGRHGCSPGWHKGEVRENLGDFWKACMYFSISFPAIAYPQPFTKQTCWTTISKRIQSISFNLNKLLNIKPWMGQYPISRTWVLLLHEYWRKRMLIGGKNTDFQRLTGWLKLCLIEE